MQIMGRSLLFVLVLFGNQVNSQISLKELVQYSSAGQQEVFTQMHKGDTALLDLLIYATEQVDSSDHYEYTARLDNIITGLDIEKLKKKSPKKQVRNIFRGIHDNLLSKYEFENNFCEVFNTGYYNCVSATALYSYALHQMEISHSIIETPSHVYAIADFNTEQWVIESTMPQQGFYKLTDERYQQYLDQLLAQKLISQKQRYASNIDSIVGAMYPSRAVSPTRLVAIQYTNLALYYLGDEQYDKALQYAIKGNLIDTDTAAKKILYGSLAKWLDNNPFEHKSYYRNLEYFAGMDSSAEALNQIKSVITYYGTKFIEDSLTAKQFAMYTRSINRGLASADRDTLKTYALSEANFSLKAINALNGSEIIAHAKNALRADSTMLEVYPFLMSGIGFLDRSQAMSYPALLELSLELDSEFWLLRKKPLWNSLVSELQLYCMLESIEAKQMKTAYKYQASFEKWANDETRPKELNRQLIENYYKRLTLNLYNQSRSRAKIALYTGLKYAPNSPALQRIKEILSL